MSNTSVSAYSLISTLPKDAVGQKFNGLVRADASVAPFVLMKGIGTSMNGASLMFAHQAVATHVQGSVIEANHPGVALVGVYLADGAASPVESGQAQLIQSTRRGELIVSGACKIPITDVTSANIYTVGSGLIHGGYIAGVDVNLGDSVTIKDGATNRFQFFFDSTSKTFIMDIPAGGIYFSSSIVHTRSIGANGATSVTLFVERP